MFALNKKLILGISALAVLSNISLYSQNQQIQKENLEAKTINYSIEKDTIKKINNNEEKFLENARGYLNEEYIYGGRLTNKNPGIDCLGLIFLAYSKTSGISWKNLSVYPSELVEKKQLGNPVKGLDGILIKDIDFSKLKEGDIIYLLSEDSIKDKPLAEINKKKYWPWHTGIYSNKEKNLFLEAQPGDKVIERNFSEVLNESPTQAIFVTRIY